MLQLKLDQGVQVERSAELHLLVRGRDWHQDGDLGLIGRVVEVKQVVKFILAGLGL